MSFLSRLFGGGGGGDNNAAKMQQFQELARQGNIQAGTQAIDDIFGAQFGDDFFKKRREAALGYYNPQLEGRYADARKKLLFDLSRSGGLDSSSAAQREADLAQTYGAGRQQIADKALSYETGARNNIENARAQLLQMLNSTGDAQGAINSAQSRLTSLSAPDSYSPIGDLFSTGLGVAGQQIALERANEASRGLVQPAGHTGLFGRNYNSKGQVVNS